jgi:Kelch motif
MSRWIFLALMAISSFAPPSFAQGCDGQGNATLSFTPGTIGGSLTATLGGLPGAPFIWAADVAPGAVTFPGFGQVCLGLTPNLFVILDTSTGGPVLPGSGVFQISYFIPAIIAPGTIVYTQFAAIDAGAPNGIAISNPASVLCAYPDTYVPVANPMASPRGLHQATTFGGGRYVLTSGGGSGQLLLPIATVTTDVFDNYTRTFTPGPNMAVARALHTATRLQSGKILIAGGVDGMVTNNWSDGEVYDPATNTFTPVANQMQNPRAAHTATLLPNGQVLLAGGNTLFAQCPTPAFCSSQFPPLPPCCCTNLPSFQSTVLTTDLYDPVTNTFVPGPNLPAKRAGHAAVTLQNGQVLLAGGIETGICFLGAAVPTLATTTFLYNPATNSFAAGASITGRILPILEVLPSGNVFCGGGGVVNILQGSLATTASVQIRNAATGAWSTGPALPHPPNAGQGGVIFAATTLANGALDIVGGGNGLMNNPASTTGGIVPLTTAYRFVEGVGYTPLASLPVARMNHTLNQVSDLTFLMTGGQDASGNPTAVNTGQIWTP